MRFGSQLIAIAGTNGSGKDTTGLLLAERHGFLFISVTELLRDECRRRGIGVTRENLRTVSAEWRRERGNAVLVEKGVEAFEALPDKDRYVGLVMSSMRNPGEADRVHELGGTMLWVDADPRVRYERIQANAASRSRAGEDDKTYEQFLAEEEAEMHAPTGSDSAVLNMAAVKERCDVFVENNSGHMDVFEKELVTVLRLPAESGN